MKDKKILLIGAASAVIVIILLVVFLPSGKKTDEGPEVISMRAKVEAPAPAEEQAMTPDTATTVVPAADGSVPAQSPQETTPAPAPMGASPVHTPAVTPAKKAEPAPVVQPKAAVQPALPAEPAVKVPVAPAVKKTEEPVKKAEVKKVTKPAAKKATEDNASKAFAINVASFANLPEAQSLAGALKKAGYNSYITHFTKDDVQWQRVRVGFFSTRAEAQTAGKAIQSRFRVEAPWIVKPEPSERKAH